VIAIDAEAEAIARLEARSDLGPDERARLQTQVAGFEEAVWPEADLVNASWALPFCPPESFPSVWRRIAASLPAGGRFSGQLFGDRDGWRRERELTFFTRGEVESLLDGFEPEHLDEVEEDGRTALGEAKHWHVFHVVARKL
jgi:tellurite methyltransferase